MQAKRDIALLSHVYTKAVEWGHLKKHPFKGEVRLKGENPAIDMLKIGRSWNACPYLLLIAMAALKLLQAYIRLKLLTGLRQGDLLSLKISDCRDDSIHIITNKTGKAIIYEWSDNLKEAVSNAIKLRPVDISPYVFCNKWGQSYKKENNSSGWNSKWHKFMKSVLEETELKERFTEHDLRAKVASDAESLERAKQLLSHADSKLTQRVYRRKIETIKPAK